MKVHKPQPVQLAVPGASPGAQVDGVHVQRLLRRPVPGQETVVDEIAGGLTEALPHSPQIQVVPDGVGLGAAACRLVGAQRSQEELLVEPGLCVAAAQIDNSPGLRLPTASGDRHG